MNISVTLHAAWEVNSWQNVDRSDGGAEGAGGFFADMGDIVSSAQRAGGNLAGRVELDVGSEVVGVVVPDKMWRGGGQKSKNHEGSDSPYQYFDYRDLGFRFGHLMSEHC